MRKPRGEILFLPDETDKSHGMAEDSGEKIPGKNNSFPLSSLEGLKSHGRTFHFGDLNHPSFSFHESRKIDLTEITLPKELG